ncbi:MAG: hypothetical protein OHK0039_47950 [Bacteroidia bacterium]
MLIAFAVLALLQACVHDPYFPGMVPGTDTTGKPCDPDTVYFTRDVLPLLISNCAMSGCHNADSHQDGVVLDSYAKVVSTAKVRAGNPNESELYEVLTDTDPDDRMPPPPAGALSSEQIALVRTWILQGAKDLTCDDTGTCDTATVTYAGTIRPLMQTYCTGCHSGTAPSGGIDLTTHTSVKTVADNGSLYGAVARQAGFAPMPQGGNPLPDCDIDQLAAWIGAGAPNN